jgi:SAM-dependent methyltransferase
LKDLVDGLLAGGNRIEQMMDLGCGEGNSLDYFREKIPGVKWVGLDIEESPEVDLRTRTDGEFHTFDGLHMPFENDCFDSVYCNQVLEHVRQPSDLLKEIHRVLRPGGSLIGATSQLEPYHSYSLWNYTPYGLSLLVEEAGLQLVEVRPSIDALTLLVRRGLGKPKLFVRWWENESPLNVVITVLGKLLRKPAASINATKLLFCGQFCFQVRKSKRASP